MRIWFGQVYIQAGAAFPFSCVFQKFLSSQVTSLTETSRAFEMEYGPDYELMFRISAKRGIGDTEIRGPTKFAKTKDVEYTLFLPYDVIASKTDVARVALGYILEGVRSVLSSLDVDIARIIAHEEGLINRICSDPIMFD